MDHGQKNALKSHFTVITSLERENNTYIMSSCQEEIDIIIELLWTDAAEVIKGLKCDFQDGTT